MVIRKLNKIGWSLFLFGLFWTLPFLLFIVNTGFFVILGIFMVIVGMVVIIITIKPCEDETNEELEINLNFEA